MIVRCLSVVAVLVLATVPGGRVIAAAPQPPRLVLEQGDHICILGGALAERMQHDGWAETLLHSRFPEHDLVVRNLGFACDELTIRQRSEGFGTPDEHLAAQQADVILACFGFNESFAGAPGLGTFKQDLEAFVKQTLAQQYNGASAPRLVLVSPIPHEDLSDPDLPDGSQNNERLAAYTQAMAEVAQAAGVPFVDLFTPSRKLYAASDEPLTINGIHLTENGNRLVAAVLDKALFGRRSRIDWAGLEKLRQAVLDKNFHWYHRYRTTDGYSSYGGRSYLKFVDDQTNREVMLRELEVLDAMAANRDRRIWAVVRGGELKIDDGNTSPFVPVKTNKPGPGPKGEHLFLDGEEAISQMTVAQGMKVNLFASEQMFPELINPVQMAWDTRGRLWVAAWPTYPHWKPKEEMNDKLLILEDTDGDGRADQCQVFADRLHNPTGFEFWGGGVLVAMAPDLLFIKDTDGDDRADQRTRVLHGLDSADTHHTANSFVIDPGGALYFQEGIFHRTQIETPYGPVRNIDACVWRFEPRTWKVDRYVPYNFANPHGHVFDRWGQDIVHDGTGANPYHAALFSGYLPFPEKHNQPPQVYQQRTRPCPATEILSSRHFPDEMQDNLLVGNVIGLQGILQYKISDQGASLAGTEMEPILLSSDANFRPSDLEIGPDGALYFTDWQNPIIGHMQHNLRDPSRDRLHGRVYRVTCEGRPLVDPLKIAGEPIERLLHLLRETENRVRYRARVELSGRDTGEVMATLDQWVAGLDQADADYQHHLTEALWLHQAQNVVNEGLLRRVLESPDFRARAAATRVLCYWRDRVPSALELLKQQAQDEHPRVRLEAIRAASFFAEPEAVEVVVLAGEEPSDVYLDFTRGETMRALDPIWKRALAEGREIPLTTEAGARFLLRDMPVEQLIARERSRAVYLELLFRPGVREEFRGEALAGLAGLDGKSEPQVLLEALATIDGRDDARDENVVFDLVRLLSGRSAAELAEVRDQIERLATSARQSIIRQVSFVALVNIDGSPAGAWDLASRNVASLNDLVQAVPLIPDASVQARFYPLVEPLLSDLPPELADGGNARGSQARYVRIELLRPGTLTLAEVEVYSEGRNVARQGKASQKNTAHGGDAGRAIDGNTQGAYGAGGQTHSEENTASPWWELDLGEERPIESIVVYNRTEGDLGKRLDGFTLRVLDSERDEVFRQDDIPAPEAKFALELAGGGPASLLRRSAMNALTYIRGQEPATFQRLAGFVRDDLDRLAAIRAMQRIPRRLWPQEEARPLVDVLLGRLSDTPTEDRTSQAALDMLEFTDALAALLPADEGRTVRSHLRELGVRVVRIGTLPERMSYDQDVIAVAAGKPVEFIFDNSDLMPHNLVITRPGALEEVGLLAEATATEPSAMARDFVPVSDKILLSSRLLQTRQSQKLSFKAPSEPGVYPIVCTYPGHWRRMYAALYVVDDLDGYLAEPEAYLANHPLPAQDPLLADRRPRTEWKFEDLSEAVAMLEEGRSFGNAAQMFRVANCIACHRLAGEGNQFGPELTKLDAKLKPADILQAILDPSEKIEDKFKTFVLTTDAGQVVTGMVLEETGDQIKMIENPLSKAEPIVLKTSEVDQREASATSIMPKGLLDKLSRDEILDLLALVIARGNPDSPLFQGGHDHEH